MEDLRYNISADASKFKSGMQEVKESAKSANETLKSLRNTLIGVFSGIAVGAFVRSTVDAAVKQEKAVDQLAQAFKNQGLYSKEAMKQWENYASSLQKVTTFGDEQIMQAQSLAVSFGLTGNKLKEVTKAAMDFSAANNVDLDTSMELLGRAFAGNTQSLTRYGIVIDTSKDKSQQFSEIIKQLNQRFGGQAEMLAHTYGGQLQQFSNAWGDLKEQIGFAVLPTLTKVTNALKNLFVELQNPQKALSDLKGWFNNLPIWSKLLLAFAGTFAVFKTVGLVWTLLSKIVVGGATMMGTAFKLLFSWPALVAVGIFMLKTAWDHNWWGIQTIFASVWSSMQNIWGSAWKDFKKIWGNPDLSLTEKVFDTIKVTVDAIAKSVQALGAGITKALGGDSQKYLKETSQILSDIQGDIKNIASNKDISVKINALIDLPKKLYQLPAKFLVSGFTSDKSFLANAVDALSAFGIIGLVTGKWRFAAGLTLLAAVTLGPGFTKNKIYNQIITAAGAGASVFVLTGSGKLAIAVSILVTAFEIATDAAKWLRGVTTYWKVKPTLTGLKPEKGNWIDDAVAWAGKTIQTTWEWTVNGLNSFYKNVLPWLGGKEIQQLWSWTVSGLSWFQDNITPKLVPTFSTGWKWAVSGLDWFYQNVLPWLGGKEILQLWSWTVNASGSFVDWLSKAEEWIGSALSTTWNWISNGLSTIIDSVDKYVSKPLNTIWNFASKNFDSIKKSIDAIGQYTGKPLETAWKFAVSGLEQILTVSKWFGAKISTIWNWTDKGLSSIIESVNQYTAKPLETVWNWSVKGADFIKDLLSDPQTIKTAWKDLSTWFDTNVWNKISAGASTAVQGITKVWNGLVDIMKSAGQKVAAAFAAPLNYAIKALNVAIKGMNLIPYVNIPLIPEIGTAPEKKAGGGLILGPGGPTDDKIPALLSNGEYVLPSWMVKSYQPLIQTLEAIRVRGYRMGGPVSSLGTSAALTAQPDYLGDMQDEMNKMATFLKSVLNPIFEKLGLNIHLNANGLDGLLDQIQKVDTNFNKIGESANKASQTLDKFASLKQAIANSSEMFTYNKDKGLQFSGVMEGIATGDWMKALEAFGAELISALSGLKNVSAVLNPFSTIIKGIVSVLEPLNAILKPFVAPLVALGKAIGSIILAFSTLLLVVAPFINVFTFAADTISWVFDQLTLGINTVLSWFGMGFLTQDQIKEMQKTPDERMKESEAESSATTQNGNTYSAGSTQPIYNNFTIIFKDNEILSDDSPAVSHLADLFIEYVKSHGGVTVFS